MSKEIAKKQGNEVDTYTMFGDDEGMDKVSDLPEIKILHTAGLFQLPDNTTTPKLEGILLHDHRHNAWWQKTLNDNEPPSAPDCFAIELVKGEPLKPHPSCAMPQCTIKEGIMKCDEYGEEYEGKYEGTCAECDLNQWGSKGDVKACNNKIALFILVPGYFVPLRLEVSPVSLKNCTDYTDSFKIKRKRYQTFATNFSLETKTKGPNTFSIINFACGREETDVEKLRGIKRIIDTYMDLMLKVPEIRNELAK